MSPQSTGERETGVKGNILIIDDSESVRKKIKSILKQAHLTEFCFEAKSGLEGIKMLMDKRVDLVICDVVMPEFDGFKFLISKSTNPAFAEIPVIMLTSEEDIEKKIKGLEQGASDYLTKPFDEGELLARVKVQLKIKHLQDELKEKNNRLRELSGTDELTKLANRRRFMENFTNEFSRAQRYKKELSFIILDVDFFKRVNDSYGHLAGDAVLVQLGEIMARNMRQCDLIARYGGEEFTLLLPETGVKGCVAHAERIRKDIEAAEFVIPNKTVRLTVSGGCASIPEMKIKTVDDFLRKADEALYIAKNNGRNKIEIAK